LWWFPRYWQSNMWYYGGYLSICSIAQPILIASRHDWYWLKGLFKGFPEPLRLWESSRNWWRYSWMKFVTVSLSEEKRGKWKTILLEKWLTTLELGEERVWVRLKHEIILLRCLLMFLIGLLSFAYCLAIRLEVTNL